MHRDRGKILYFFLGILLIALLIQTAGFVKGDDLVFPPLSKILASFVRLLFTGHTWKLIATTLRHLLISLALATLAGIALGTACGLFEPVRLILEPLMILLRSIPMIVLVVIVMVLSSYDLVPLVVTGLILVPLISEGVCTGFRKIDPELVDVYRLNSGFNLQVLTGVYLPLIAGYLKVSYVNALGMGIKLTVSCEYLVQTRDSLGKAVNASSYFNDYEDIYAYALIMVLLVLAVSRLPMSLGVILEKGREGRIRDEQRPFP